MELFLEPIVECFPYYSLCIGGNFALYIHIPGSLWQLLVHRETSGLTSAVEIITKMTLLILPSPHPKLYCNNPLAKWDDIVTSDSYTHTMS